MAKVNIQFDTTSKELAVTFDGKSIPNVHSVNLSKGYYYDEKNKDAFRFNLMTLDNSKDEDEGYSSLTQIMAKESNGASELKDRGAIDHPDIPNFLLLKTEAANKVASMKNIIAAHRVKRRN